MAAPIEKKTKPKRMTPAEQSEAFIEAAKKAEADERPEEFEKVLKKVAPKKPHGRSA
jgi:hypothetical protein